MTKANRGPRFEHGEQSSAHFDPEANPRYLMVREGDSGRVVVVNGKDLVAKSQNEHVASVEDRMTTSDGRKWRIWGHWPPHTYIELFDAKGKRSPVRLEVDVKPKKFHTIAFTYVIQDGNRDKTTRDPSIPDVLVKELDDIYIKQTNIVFNEDPTAGTKTPRTKNIQVSTSLFDIVFEKEHGPRDGRKPNREWDTLTAEADPTAEINVFFMPHQSTGNLRQFNYKSKVLIKEGGPVYVFPDGMSDDEVRIALPHWVGVFFGCKETANGGHQHHLMFWTRADGHGDVHRFTDGAIATPPFIPRDWVRTMNP